MSKRKKREGKNEKLVIRPVREGDLKAIYEIAIEAYRYPWTFEELKKSLQLNSVGTQVAELGNGENWRVAGYMIYQCDDLVFINAIHIIQWAVEKNMRRKGIGRKIFQHALKASKWFKGAVRIITFVPESNKNVKKFLSEMQFEEVEVLPAFYKNPSQDACFMQYITDKCFHNRLLPYFFNEHYGW